MKLFSIFNKPDSKLNNKQKGQTFMELVIILLIAGTAVICIIWYFYWVLQSSVIDLKYKLEDVRTAMNSQCGLPKPAGDQPGALGFPYSITAYDDIFSFGDVYKYIPIAIPYPRQAITITNIDITGKDFHGSIWFFGDGGLSGSVWDNAKVIGYYSYVDLIGLGTSNTYNFDLSPYPFSPPYYILIDPYDENEGGSIQNRALVSVNVTEY